MTTTAATVHARAAIAGNPSDGFDGAVCSLVLPFFAATATVAPAEALSVEFPIVQATLDRFTRELGNVGPVAINIETSIPRAVGLAGSSAIVIAVLRALAPHVSVDLADMEVARLAHSVERSDMAIPGGWQDQLIQSHGCSALVECAEPKRVAPLSLPDTPIPMYLAWSEAAGESSGEAHTGLRQERRVDDPAMLELADLARAAAAAFHERDVHRLKEAIDGTFDIRRQIMHIAPAQLAMVDTARALGASSNFAGSGGAIVGVLPKAGDDFIAAMNAAGYDITTWESE